MQESAKIVGPSREKTLLAALLITSEICLVHREGRKNITASFKSRSRKFGFDGPPPILAGRPATLTAPLHGQLATDNAD
jgi:hypothetical protein